MALYDYHLLNRERKQIRILILNPAPLRDSNIECELQIVDLTKALRYEALSYVWGETEPRGNILLHGISHTVTPNLETALRYLRYTDRPRPLWVDAICINQNDVAERDSQVQMMAEIYTTATTTLSWLGEAADGSDEAMELIRTLGDWALEHEDEIFDGEDPPETVWTVTQAIEWLGFPLQEQNWPVVWRLLERPYWTRVWIIQELAVRGRITKASGVFICGTEKVDRPQYDWCCALLVLIVSSPNAQPGTLDMQEPVRSLLVGGHPPGLTMLQVLAACTGGENRDLSWLLRGTMRFKATDARDKVYALLGMAKDGDMLTPSYGEATSYEQVVRSFVVSSIGRYASLGVLLGNRFRVMPHGPSWVPDLLCDEYHGAQGLIPAVELDYFRAAGSITPVVTFDDAQTVLSARGILVGEIEKVIGPLRMAEKGIDAATAQDIRTIAASVGQDAFFQALQNYERGLPDPDSRTEFWQTLCMNGDWTQLDPVFPAPDDFALKQRVIFGQEPVPADFMPGQPENARYRKFVYPYISSLQRVLANRTFITLQGGRMGIGPYVAQTGDVVAVLFGAAFCLVLRPVGGRQYRLVGDAYVHNVMRGELVKESRPEDGRVFDIV